MSHGYTFLKVLRESIREGNVLGDGSVGAGGEGVGVTWKVGRLSRPGKSSMSPVAMLKQAPCHGQRTCPFDSTPGKKEHFQQSLLKHFQRVGWNMWLAFDQRCSIVRTLVTHG